MRRALQVLAVLIVLAWTAGAAAGPEARNGKIAFVSGGDIWVVTPDGSGLQNLTHSPAREAYPTWSPEGTRIVYSSNRGAARSLWIMNADGGDPRRLTHPGRGVDTTPSLSPDGRRVVFARRIRGNQELYVINLDGTGVRRLTRYPGIDFDPSWSPDGSEIVFWRALPRGKGGKGNTHEIFTVNTDGGGLRRLTWGASSDAPAWAPDGKRIAFTRYVRGRGDIWIMRADGTGQQRIAGGASDDDDPTWSPDGSAIAFASDRDGTPNIYVVTVRTPKKVSRVTKPPAGASAAPRAAITPAWQPVP